MLNPKVKVKDRIVCIHMDGDHKSVPTGTKGTVMKVQKVPFSDRSDYNYLIDWDNGSKLALEPDLDVWMLEKDVKKKTIPDSEPISEIFVGNEIRNRVKQNFLIDQSFGPKIVKNSDDIASIKEDLKRMVLQNIIK